jgi:hypothetical protein
MRNALFTLALLASAFTLPLTAHADTIDDFALVGQGHTITYSLPSSAILVDHPHGIILGASAPTTIDGVPGYNEFGQYYLPGFPNLPGIVLSVPSSIDGGTLTFYGQWPLQVSEVIPMGFGQPDDLLVAFVPGTYNLTLGNPGIGFPPPAYTLTITAESAATPEPSNLILLATGSFCFLGVIRSRHNHRGRVGRVAQV